MLQKTLFLPAIFAASGCLKLLLQGNGSHPQQHRKVEVTPLIPQRNKPVPVHDPVYNTQEAASYLGMHEETLKKMARQREIGHVRSVRGKGSPVKFRLSDLNAWAEARQIRPLRRQGG